MDCKVIHGFDLSYNKTLHCLLFLLSDREEKSEKLFGLDLGLVGRHFVGGSRR